MMDPLCLQWVKKWIFTLRLCLYNTRWNFISTHFFFLSLPTSLYVKRKPTAVLQGAIMRYPSTAIWRISLRFILQPLQLGFLYNKGRTVWLKFWLGQWKHRKECNRSAYVVSLKWCTKIHVHISTITGCGCMVLPSSPDPTHCRKTKPLVDIL